MPTRTARTGWTGTLEQGVGKVELTSSKIGTYDVSFPKRAADDAGGWTSPEELIAAAHSACYAMQLSALIGQAGGTPQALDVQADVSLGPDPAGGFRLTASSSPCAARSRASTPSSSPRRPRTPRPAAGQQGADRRRHHLGRRAGGLELRARRRRERWPRSWRSRPPRPGTRAPRPPRPDAGAGRWAAGGEGPGAGEFVEAGALVQDGCRGRSRADRVRGDAGAAQLDGQGADEAGHACLGRAVAASMGMPRVAAAEATARKRPCRGSGRRSMAGTATRARVSTPPRLIQARRAAARAEAARQELRRR